jgi:asparagine synthase (glutamine-hydrolysing)
LREGLAALLPRSAARLLRPLVDGDARAPGWLDLRRLGAAARHPFDEFEDAHRASVDALSRAQLLRTSLPMLLHWEDRDSMAHSIEARVPFLDYRLVELALGLPEEFKIAAGVTKRVLREAMTGILPEVVRTRTDKLGFQTPEEEWMRESPAEFRAALARAIDASDGIITPAALRLLDDVVERRRPFSFLPWRLIAFGAWIERFGVRREA